MDFILLTSLFFTMFGLGAIIGHAVGYEKGRDEGRRR